MKSVSEIRKDNLELLIAELGSVKAVAELGDTSEIYISQIRNGAIDKKTGNPRSMGSKIARRLEKGRERGWMDKAHQDNPIQRYLDQIEGLLHVIPEALREAAVLEAVASVARFLPGGARHP